jgi:hypothetical protein
MTVFQAPPSIKDYQSLCNAVQEELNRYDLTSAIPLFTQLATKRIERDLSRAKHQMMIKRAATVFFDLYCSLPCDYIAAHQLMETNTDILVDYIGPNESKEWLSGRYPIPNRTNVKTNIAYYTIIGDQLRIFPYDPLGYKRVDNAWLDFWYYAQLPELTPSAPTNWVLTRYSDIYFYGTLAHSAPYLKADERLNTWESIYSRLMADIETEAERGVRSGTRLVAARRSF